MIEVTIRLNREVHRRLRSRAQQAGTSVAVLVSDLVQASALLLTDPELITPPRSVIRKVADLLDHDATAPMIAQQLGLSDDVVNASIRELERLKDLAERYTR